MGIILTPERFAEMWTPVPESGCWLWDGCCSKGGYGRIKLEGEARDTHRVSYEIHIGPIPGGTHVLHYCDTPACVRPDHLFLGTHRDNMKDKCSKMRHSFGERHPTSKIDKAAVRAIKASPMTQRAIAAKYGISQSQVHRIKTGKNWKHINAETKTEASSPKGAA